MRSPSAPTAGPGRADVAPAVRRPTVRFLLHGAERSGPPVYLLRLFRSWADAQPAFDAQLVLARPGPLSAELGRVVTTRNARLDRRSPELLVERGLTDLGLGSAGRRLSAVATRARVGRAHADATVVNGATAPTVELLRRLRPTGPVLTIAHELSTGWFGNLTAADRALLLHRTDGFLAVSESVVRFLTEELGVDPGRVEMVHPPVGDEHRADRRAAGDRVVVAGSGMTDWRKAPELWLRVAAAVTARRPGAHVQFVWVGGDRADAPASWPLRHELRHLGLEGHVEFLGQIDAPEEVLASATVFVSTAREDAYPLACAEAMALGVPVVGFDVDGVAEMVRESGGGDVVAYPDHDALADRVVDLIDDHARRAELGRRGAAFARTELSSSVVAPAVAAWIERSLPSEVSRP